jgi:uncharacterized protein involved in exopolysaccharide biosynthesis
MNHTTEVNLTDIVRVVGKRFGVFLGLFILVMVVDVLVTVMSPPVYRASATMIIQNDASLYPAGTMPQTAADNVFLNTQREIISSSFIITAALKDLKNQGMLKGVDYYALKNKISVRYVGDSNLLDVASELGNQEDAVALSNAIVNAFVAYHSGSKTELIDRSLSVVNKELAAIKANQDELRLKLNDFRDKEQLNYYQAQIPYYITNLLDLNKKNLSIDADVSRIKDELIKTGMAIKNGDTRFFYPLITASGSSGENPTSSVASIPWMQDLKKKIVETEANLNRISPEYTDNNPEVLGLRSQLVTLQENLDKELSRVLVTYIEYYRGYLQFLETQRKANSDEKARNETELVKISERIDKAAARQIEFDMLLKNYQALQDVYGVFLHKQNELLLLKEQTVSLPNMRVFDTATLPARQVVPNVPLNMGLGVFCGVLIGIAGCLSQEKKKYSPDSAPYGMAADKRGMARINKSFVVAYEAKDSRGAQVRRYASTENLSGSGVLLKLKEYVPCDTQLELEIHVADKDFIKASGRIIWINTVDEKKGLFDAGVHLVKIEPGEREKLINYLYGESYYAAK